VRIWQESQLFFLPNSAKCFAFKRRVELETQHGVFFSLTRYAMVALLQCKTSD